MNFTNIKRGQKMKEYQFTITICGTGENGAQAWDDAVEGFCSDSGLYDADDITAEEEIEEETVHLKLFFCNRIQNPKQR
jgi:hypothetical protein